MILSYCPPPIRLLSLSLCLLLLLSLVPIICFSTTRHLGLSKTFLVYVCLYTLYDNWFIYLFFCAYICQAVHMIVFLKLSHSVSQSLCKTSPATTKHHGFVKNKNWHRRQHFRMVKYLLRKNKKWRRIIRVIYITVCGSDNQCVKGKWRDK